MAEVMDVERTPLSLLITPLAVFLFPSYASYKAVKKNNQKMIAFWVKYWMIFGTFWLVEFWLEVILSRVWGYYFVKLCFFLWLQIPMFRGAEIAYDKLLRPFLKKYEKDIEKHMERGKAEIGKSVDKGMIYLKDYLVQWILGGGLTRRQEKPPEKVE